MLRHHAPRRPLAVVLCTATIVALGVLSLGRGRRSAEAAPLLVESSADNENTAQVPPLSLDRVEIGPDGHYRAVLAGDARAELTFDPVVQQAARAALDEQAAPMAGVVVLSVRDGRVLALAGRDGERPERDEPRLALEPWAPAASVFKVVTAAALVERGVRADERVCYHGGVHSVEMHNLKPNKRIDRECNDLAYGVAKSQNAIMARLANDHLSAERLSRTARALGFGVALPVGVPVSASAAEVPADKLAFARTAAGFWNSTLSPLHGAWIAATVARGGVTPPLRMVDRIVMPGGGAQGFVPETPAPVRVMAEKVARQVGAMMVGTTEYGTARLGFRDGRGRSFLPVSVAGKTGSLSGFEHVAARRPTREREDDAQKFVAYSWFVGYAPADNPEVAVAVLLGNDVPWRPRAHQTARKILSAYFAGRPAPAQLVAKK